MNDLQLIKSENFGAVSCDFYERDSEFYMTREQIGAALEYSNPQRAISDLHRSHKERLDQFSRVTKISYPSGGTQNTILYTRKGIMEICRWSQQPKADAFMDWAWEVIDGLITGRTAVISNKPVSPNELILMMAQANIGLEKRVDKIEQKVDTALQVFARPDKDHWKEDIEASINNMVRQYGLSPVAFRGKLYRELESTSNTILQSRLSRMRNRLRKQGHTYREARAVSKLDVISKDTKLRPIFEGIVKKYRAVYGTTST